MTDQWITAAELATLYGVPASRVHYLAHVHAWARSGTRPQRYLIRDIIDSDASFTPPKTRGVRFA